MIFRCLRFPPKNEQKQVDLRYNSSKDEFFRSFFGGNRRHQKPCRNYLTFTYIKSRCIFNMKNLKAISSLVTIVLFMKHSWFFPLLFYCLNLHLKCKCNKLCSMAIWVVEFSNGGCITRNIFA